MAEFFTILVVRPAAEPSCLQSPIYSNAMQRRLSEEFALVVADSRNAKVKSGFSVQFIPFSDPRSTKIWSELPLSTFRVHLVQQKKDESGIISLVNRVAPESDAKALMAQMKAEGGLGGRSKIGENSAFVSTTKFEEGLLFDSTVNLKHLTNAGLQMGGLAAHELGHAMGIPKNQGNGLMSNQKFVIDLEDSNVPISRVHFEPNDKKIILPTLEGIAGKK